MRDLIFDFPDKNDFVLVDSCVLVPVEISHCVKLSSVCSLAPCGKKRTMNLVDCHEVLNNFGHFKEMILNIIKKFLIFDPN